MSSKPLVTAERLRQLLRYDPQTGQFHWRVSRGVAAGRRAGLSAPNGYRLIRVDKRLYREHRLAWLYVYGAHPNGEIDHINGDGSDNRISNLRECSRSENARNASGRRPGALKGTYQIKNRWFSRICINRRTLYLGSYATAEEAAAAYDAAARRWHGRFACLNTAADAAATSLLPQRQDEPMKASDALIAWTPADSPSGTRAQVKIGPIAQSDWAAAYARHSGAALAYRRPLKGSQTIVNVLIDFHAIVVRDGIDPKVAHEAFMVIDEYAEAVGRK
jgi:hypothetical protein